MLDPETFVHICSPSFGSLTLFISLHVDSSDGLHQERPRTDRARYNTATPAEFRLKADNARSEHGTVVVVSRIVIRASLRNEAIYDPDNQFGIQFGMGSQKPNEALMPGCGGIRNQNVHGRHKISIPPGGGASKTAPVETDISDAPTIVISESRQRPLISLASRTGNPHGTSPIAIHRFPIDPSRVLHVDGHRS